MEKYVYFSIIHCQIDIYDVNYNNDCSGVDKITEHNHLNADFRVLALHEQRSHTLVNHGRLIY